MPNLEVTEAQARDALNQIASMRATVLRTMQCRWHSVRITGALRKQARRITRIGQLESLLATAPAEVIARAKLPPALVEAGPPQ